MLGARQCWVVGGYRPPGLYRDRQECLFYLRLGLQVGQQMVQALRCHFMMEVVVDLHGRRPGTGPDAFHFFERKPSVGRGLSRRDSEPLLCVGKEFFASAQQAGDVRADLEMIPSGRFLAQHGGIGNHALDLEDRQVEPPGNLRNDLWVQEPALVLSKEQHGHQRGTLEGIVPQELLELCFELWAELHGFARPFPYSKNPRLSADLRNPGHREYLSGFSTFPQRRRP